MSAYADTVTAEASVSVDPPHPLAVTVSGKETTLSEVTVSVVLNVIENVFVPPATMSLPTPPELNCTVPEHDADHPAGGPTDAHVQSEPEAGVTMLTVRTVQPLPLYTDQVSVWFVAPLATTAGERATE